MNTGHGHVTPREDGIKARCGGPAMCFVCQGEVLELDNSLIVARSQMIRLLENVRTGKVSVEYAEKRISFTMETTVKSAYDYVKRELKILTDKFLQ